MPDDPIPRVWRVKFFPDLRSQTPARIAYISRTSEAEVAQRVAECVVDGETARVEICPVILHPPILAEGAEYWLD